MEVQLGNDALIFVAIYLSVMLGLGWLYFANDLTSVAWNSEASRSTDNRDQRL